MAETVKASNIEVISAVDLAKRYLGDTPEAQEATREDVMSQLSPEQREVAQHMMDKMENWLKDNPMLLYGEKDGKPFIYDMTDREYDKYMVLDDEQKEKYLQKLLANKEAAAVPVTESKEAVVQAHSDLNKDGATVDTEKKGQAQTVSSGQKFGLLELLKVLLQAFGFIPPEQERKAEVKNDVTETQQKQQDQQEQKQQSTTVDRSIAAQAKALSEANTEALVADQQQSQQNNRGLHF